MGNGLINPVELYLYAATFIHDGYYLYTRAIKVELILMKIPEDGKINELKSLPTAETDEQAKEKLQAEKKSLESRGYKVITCQVLHFTTIAIEESAKSPS